MATKTKTAAPAPAKKQSTAKESKVMEKPASQKATKSAAPKAGPNNETKMPATPKNAIGARATTRNVPEVTTEKAPKSAAKSVAAAKPVAAAKSAKTATVASKSKQPTPATAPAKGSAKTAVQAKPTAKAAGKTGAKKPDTSTPVEPYKGNSKIGGSRTRLTAEGERPV